LWNRSRLSFSRWPITRITLRLLPIFFRLCLISNTWLIVQHNNLLRTSFYWLQNMSYILQLLSINRVTSFLLLLLLLSTLDSLLARSAPCTINSWLASFLGTLFNNEAFHESGAELGDVWFVEKLDNTSFLDNSVRIITALFFEVGVHDFAMLVVADHVH